MQGSACQIISLGCGYDPTYFHLAHQKRVDNLLFIDVDFPDLVTIKRDVIRGTERISSMLHQPDFENDMFHIHSEKYVLLGCDLRQLDKLANLLDRLDKFDWHTPTLLLSECVITYMPTAQADAVLEWSASRFPESVTVIYEQVCPNDAFGQTMLRHFDKLDATIYAIHKYPSIHHQCQRLLELGFQSGRIWDMNRFWFHLDSEERQRVQGLEWFDEYEEWHVKCAHYFVAFGLNGYLRETWSIGDKLETIPRLPSNPPVYQEQVLQTRIQRWGHVMLELSEDRFLVFGGYGMRFSGEEGLSKWNDYIITDSSFRPISIVEGRNGPSARIFASGVCHGGCCYLYGGRDSPAKVYNDLWKFDGSGWTELKPTGELPPPLFRHRCVLISKEAGCFGEPVMLVFGGQTLNQAGSGLTLSNQFYLFGLNSKQWTRLPELDIPALHSHAMVTCKDRLVIFGGMTCDQIPSNRCFMIDYANWSMTERILDVPARFGHSLHTLSEDELLIVGGVSGQERPLSPSEVISIANLETGHASNGFVDPSFMPCGFTLHFNKSESVLTLIGGGAICFSMGAHLNLSRRVFLSPEWKKEFSPLPWIRESSNIPRVEIDEIECVAGLVAKREPFIVSGVNFGECLSMWAGKSYLKQAYDGKVSVHVCKKNKLAFETGLGRNYEYETMEWNAFLDGLFDREDERSMYLRSIGINPRKEPSNMARSFTKLSGDITLPSKLTRVIAPTLNESHASYSVEQLSDTSLEETNFFSSVLRIASPRLQLWTHFDMMDNYLCQVVGTKLITLFPPSQAENLYLTTDLHQSSSPVVDIFAPFDDPVSTQSLPATNLETVKKYPKFFQEAVKQARVDILKPGEVLFIPALWFHNTFALDQAEAKLPAISANIFWRHLETPNYDRKDLYGNKDLVKAVQAHQHVLNAMDLLKNLPEEYRDFYRDRFHRLLNQE